MNEHSAPDVPAVSSTRREFLKLGAVAGVGAAVAPLAGCARHLGSLTEPQRLFAVPPMPGVRIGFVGVGGMGSNHVHQLLKVPGAEIRAVCDIVPEKVARIQDVVVQAGQRRPTGYDRGPRDFERLCEQEELDLIYTATPWEWHVPVCVAAMRAGKHAATEVPAAVTIDECWELVETAEKYGKHCVMMENCCYDRPEMMVLNMVRKGLFGEVLHGECGYLHDLRGVKFSTEGEGLWRRAHSMTRDGNLYPTHGLGPIAQCMDVNRGDRFDYLVSMSGPSRGLQLHQQEHLAADDPRRNEKYVLGDLNLTLIKTVKGRTIYLVHDTNLPRPYSRIHMLQGTRGLKLGYPDRIHIEGRSPAHEWEPLDNYKDEFEHPLWKSESVRTASGGHGGMDYLEDYRLIRCLIAGEPLDMDVYDAAAWSCISELTERSVAHRSRSVNVPDFTRGTWRVRPPVPIVEG
ncbi:MAG TPA: Gfo/Idh/MocA family oxidoreductase [Phycisphaerae bacterium]|nr:Gfo/Idh/MocA family oxidoreductase [Phycisphaerae bacterium]HNU45394.1 Gfo/Idh/MocA family oxidoreductase [Phycisphaerae bacterium]